MPTFFGYSVALFHDRRITKRNLIAKRFHEKLVPEMDYAGVFHDQQVNLDKGLWFRPQFKRLHSALRLGDCVCFIELEQCFESLADMIEKAGDLASMGIRVMLADARIDTGTKEGKAFLRSLHWSLGFDARRHDIQIQLNNMPIV